VRPLLLLAVLLLAGCAASGGAPAPDPEGPAGAAQPVADDAGPPDELVVELDRGDGSPVRRWTLRCADPVTGDHPDAAAACAHLNELDDPFAPIPADAVCTEVYGGPQIARITGRWRGQPVDLRLSRVNGCFITQWDRLGPLLPGPAGVLPG
jgi:Subtilisin inhibitor-like